MSQSQLSFEAVRQPARPGGLPAAAELSPDEWFAVDLGGRGYLGRGSRGEVAVVDLRDFSPYFRLAEACAEALRAVKILGGEWTVCVVRRVR